MELVESLSDLDEDVAHEAVILPLGLVEELDQFDTLAVLHDEEAHIQGLSILFRPDGVLLKFKVLGNSRDFEVLHNCHFVSCLLDDLVSFGGVWLEYLHSIVDTTFPGKFDHSVSAKSECSDDFVISTS